MSKSVRHTRCPTELQNTPSIIKSTRSNASAMRLNTSPFANIYQTIQTINRGIKSRTCFQRAHLITISAAKTAKPDKAANSKAKQCDNDEDTKYTLEKPIAKGAFGLVFKAHSATQHQLAIKKILINKNTPNRQLAILQSIEHPNLLKLIDHYYTAEEGHRYLHLVTPYYPFNLKTAIERKCLNLQIAPFYLQQILHGLAELKQKDIIHLDLKPANILVDKESNRVAIADFGSAKINSYSEKHSFKAFANHYSAPQLAFGSVYYSNSVDMWAFGCIAIELVTGGPLFHAKSTLEHMLQIIKLLGTPTQAEMTEMNPNYSLEQFQQLPKMKKKALRDIINSSNPLFIDLLAKILTYSPAKRLSPNEALQHPYFANIHSQQPQDLHKLQPEEKKDTMVSYSSLRNQSKHRRIGTDVSKLSESTAWRSTVDRDESKGIEGLIARKLFNSRAIK